MNNILCNVCNSVFDDVLSLLIHKFDEHKIIQESDKKLLSKWVDVK